MDSVRVQGPVDFTITYSTCIAVMEDESAAARSIDAFFLNPAYMENQKSQPTVSVLERVSGGMKVHDRSSPKSDLTHERQTSSATITSIVDEPVFWHGYTSDEEAASPIAGDDMEWDAMDDASFEELPQLSPMEEQRAIVVRQAHQLCTHAQAVTILSAGRPKMVTVPKSIDSPRSACESQFSSLPTQLQAKRASTHMRASSWDAPTNDRNSSDYSQKDSLDSSGCVSPLSTAPSSILEQPPRSHRMSVSSKHIPLMEAARHVPLMEAARLGSPHSPTSSLTGGLNSSYLWSQPPAPTSAPRSSMSQIKSGVLSALINKFDSSESSARRGSRTSTNNISRIGKQFLRRDTLEDVEDQYISRMAEPTHEFHQPASPIIRLPVRNTSTKPSRMVARGADERAPVLTLPTCPDEFTLSFESEWPLYTQFGHANPARITTVA